MLKKKNHISVVGISIGLVFTVVSYRPTEAIQQPLATPCSIPSFGPATTISVGNTSALAVADFNKDNKQDLVVPINSVQSIVRILLGDGTGGFINNGNFSVGRNPISVAVADFNGDSNTDVVTANFSSFNGGEASVILGTGTGSFGAPTHIRWSSPGTVTNSVAVAVADFNSDGKTDIAVTSSGFLLPAPVLIALGNGMGQFPTLQYISTGGAPRQIVADDLNGDSKPDLALLKTGSNTVSVLLGDGSGQFAPGTDFVVGTAPQSLTKGDFNGDGRLDLATANAESNNISVLLNIGSGSFGPAVNYTSGGLSVAAVTPGDFDADGQLDLAVVNQDPRSILILRNQGAGSFRAIANFLHGGILPQFIAVGEFNSDERTDLAIANALSQTVSIMLNNCQTPAAPTIRLVESSFASFESLGNHVTVTRTGSLEGAVSVQYASTDGSAVEPDDYAAVSGTLNFSDGEASKKIDLTIVEDVFDEQMDESFQITLSNASGSATLGTPATAPVFIIDDDPPPQISISNSFIPEGNSGTTTARLAVTLSAPSGLQVTVNYGTADGSAASGSDYMSASGTLTFLPGQDTKTIDVSIAGDVVGEIDENFLVNLSSPTNATLAVSQAVGLILDDDSACPAPKFQLSSNLSLNNPTDAAIGDFNGDTKKDLVVASRTGNTVALFLSDGNGGFAAPSSFGVGTGPRAIAVADFNGDLKLDVVTVNESSSMSVLLGNGTGGFAPATTTMVSNPHSVSVGDVNTDGKQDLAIVSTAISGQGSVSILLGDGAGGFGAPTSYTTGQSSLFGTLAHLNADNKLDIAVANLNSFDVSILLNNGDGTFGGAANITLGYNVQSLVTGELNGDSKLDLVALGSDPVGKLSVLLGSGNGTFSMPATSTVSPAPFRGVLADLNNDGRLDLATANPVASDLGSLLVLFGNGAGAFSSPTPYAVGMSPVAVAIADFNSDTKPDIAVPNLNSAQLSILLNTCSTTPVTTFQFSSGTYAVFEGNSSLSITVIRNGDTSGTSSVDYITTDTDNFTVNCGHLAGNAFARCDFATSVDTLTFAPGETSKTFSVPIINDSLAEGPEAFGITLTNATGGATLGAASSATITINDSEIMNGPNPIFNTQFFVRQHYLDFLSREPDLAGFNDWVNLLNNCPDVNNDPACDRITVSRSFFGSLEFQLKGYFVYRFYKLAFNRLPLYQEIVVDMRAVTGATEQEVFAKKATFTNKFAQRPEFTGLYNGQTNSQYVNSLMGRYSLASITTPDPANPDGATKVTLTTAELINRLDAATLTRAQVLRAIADSDEVFFKEFNSAFVAMQYYGYLRRTPDEAGFNDWLEIIAADPNDIRTMINGFMNSQEYRLRFGPQ